MTKRDRKLQSHLIYLLEQSKQNYKQLSSINAELVSIRETIRGLDPTFSEVLDVKRLATARKAFAFEQSVLAVYDAMLAEVKDDWP